MNRGLFLALFFISGAVGLVYETVWVRQLTLLFGVSIYAVSAVLVAFMGGLGVGAAYFGKKLDRGFAPVRLYALLEVAVGVYVLLFPFVMALVEKAYLLFHHGGGGTSFQVVAFRLALSVAALLLPTALMGGTLPALGKFLSQDGRDVGKSVGTLYAVNTIGAVTGCLAAGFWLIENIGLTNTLRAGAAVNILCGIAAFMLARGASPAAETPPKQAKAGGEAATALRGPLLFLFGLSGFCAMALEVFWTRMLVLLLNNTTYAFSIILAIFLAGIGTGSAVLSRGGAKTPPDAAALFARFQMGVGLFALVSLVGFALTGYLMGLTGAFGGPGMAGRPLAEALLFCAVTVFPCTFLMGGSFPLVVGAFSASPETTGGAVGRLYAVNIVGCVLGSLAAGYLLIPLVGIRTGVLAVAWLAVAGGVYLMMKAANKPAFSRAAIPAGAALAVTVLALLLGDTGFILSVKKLDDGARIDYYREGPSATVLVSSQESDLTVFRKPVKRIWINGDPIAGSFREALQLERLQAHIPLMMHPDPKKALVICFGTGTTAGTVIQHGVESVTAVDISREVFGAAGEFSEANFNAASSPALRMVEEDGRNFLLTTDEKFDFITSEPPPPSNAGVVNLYTVEYYRLAKNRLAKGGLVSQWIPLHHLSPEDFRALVATFLEVFPNAAMWYTKWDAIMVGAEGEIPLDFAMFENGMKNPAVAASLGEIGVQNPHQLLSNFMMKPDQLRLYAAGAGAVTDDRPYVEFTAPRAHSTGVAVKARNLEELLKFRAMPDVRFASDADKAVFGAYFRSQEEFLRGQVRASDGQHGEAARHFGRALEINPDNADARYAYLSLNIATLYSALSNDRPELGLKMLDDTEKLDTGALFAVQSHFLRGMFFAKKGSYRSAEAEFLEAIRLDSRYIMAVANLAGLYGFKLENQARARDLYGYALTLEPSEMERHSIEEALAKLNGA